MEYTYLDAINYCISQIGAAPVSSEDDLLPDVQDAKLRLKEASLSLQKTGWWFNTDDRIILPIDINNEIPVPNGTLKVVAQVGDYYTVRDQKLYNHSANTSLFEQDVCLLQLVVWLDWENLAPEAQDYIRISAAQDMILHNLEDHNKAAGLDGPKINAMLELKKSDLQIKKRNNWYNPKFRRVRGGVQPYRSAQRNPNYPGGN